MSRASGSLNPNKQSTIRPTPSQSEFEGLRANIEQKDAARLWWLGVIEKLSDPESTSHELRKSVGADSAAIESLVGQLEQMTRDIVVEIGKLRIRKHCDLPQACAGAARAQKLQEIYDVLRRERQDLRNAVRKSASHAEGRLA